MVKLQIKDSVSPQRVSSCHYYYCFRNIVFIFNI